MCSKVTLGWLGRTAKWRLYGTAHESCKLEEVAALEKKQSLYGLARRASRQLRHTLGEVENTFSATDKVRSSRNVPPISCPSETKLQ